MIFVRYILCIKNDKINENCFHYHQHGVAEDDFDDDDGSNDDGSYDDNNDDDDDDDDICYDNDIDDDYDNDDTHIALTMMMMIFTFL